MRRLLNFKFFITLRQSQDFSTLRNQLQSNSTQYFTDLTTRLDIRVDSWVGGHAVAVKVGLREFVEDRIVVSSDSGNLRQVLTFLLLNFLRNWCVLVILQHKTIIECSPQNDLQQLPQLESSRHR